MLKTITRWRNRLIAFGYDLCVIPVAWVGAYWLRFDLHEIPLHFLHQALVTFPFVMLLQAIICWNYGLYRGVWRFASIPDLTRIVKSSVLGTVFILILSFFLRSFVELPRAVPLLYLLLLVGGLSGARATFRWLKDYRQVFYDSKKVLIIGAGNAGEGLIRDLIRHAKRLYHPVAILDDNPVKLRREIHGIPVVGRCDQLKHFTEEYDIDLIMIATPSATAAQMRHIVALCVESGVSYRTLPALGDVAEGKVDIKQLREVALEDLLGRDPVNLDWKSLSAEFQGKVILIAGGGGSIGSELCRQLAQLAPQRLIILDHHEYNLYAIDIELRKKFPHLNLVCLLQDIKEKLGLEKIFTTYAPSIVFHAAAYKHVPLLESQICAGISNNIFGTRMLAETAVAYKAQKFVLISTDKAVNPTNVMGATKRAAEIFCQNLNDRTSTEFITVRFGNVLDSAGSVVPLFRKQLQEGGPITVTHPEITRFFMTIPEASQLIIQAAHMGKGGEIFVLDMGEPIKIQYLAEQMIRLSGKIPDEDIRIVYTGLRPGEKLYEELFHDQEVLRKTAHQKIMLADARKVVWKDWLVLLDELQMICDKEENTTEFLKLLHRLVPEFVCESNTINLEANVVHLSAKFEAQIA